jgi:hypothetical protein
MRSTIEVGVSYDLVHHTFFGVPITNPFPPGGRSQSHGRTRLSVRLPTWTATIWKKSRCTPISERRGIDEEGVRVRLTTMIEATGVNGQRRLR